MSTAEKRLYAVSDLHVSYQENQRVLDGIRPSSENDWLIVAGDVAETVAAVRAALELLSRRFARVLWVPGNHELWTHPRDEVGLRGNERYLHLVRICRELGVTTPEDPYPVWTGPGGPAAVVPLFLLYDYSFLPPGAATREDALKRAYDAGVVCTDEFLLHPDPYPDRASWCAARVEESERRLSELDPSLPTVLVNHWPLVRQPTDVLHHPEFAQWCGTTRTADWHVRFNALASVYGHLHIPRGTRYDGVRFEEVSLGYPREWRRRGPAPNPLRQILPHPR
ncbi:metallophosphoesterase family protein [Actinorugispora endophytica]|uniref:3',5'-cyclic AMP phosphodiesterase CpdA n=1 Tax=Actinorugispora endophytica TaxID=1605990 RepID=A0A4R6UB73_9ACTN|nr:metallophosphoesterase [Actinorugispora endophytica]TDQ43898.1 3',5'-cyclic AMP phosphodiesterase CpdA [Actinorugispora endophytica]